MANARRKIHDVHARTPTDTTTEALRRIGELFAIEAEIRSSPAEERLAVRKAKTTPLMHSLYDWTQLQMTVLSRHSDTAKAFAYLLKQWDALNLYCGNGWAEIDNNIAGNGQLCSLIGTCRLNAVDPGAWLCYVLGHIQDWSVNRMRELLLWKADLTST